MGMVRMAAVSPAASGKLSSKTAVNFADATVVLGSGPIIQRANVIEVPFRGGSDERFVSVEREQ
jgi:hypothetical protein